MPLHFRGLEVVPIVRGTSRVPAKQFHSQQQVEHAKPKATARALCEAATLHQQLTGTMFLFRRWTRRLRPWREQTPPQQGA